LALTRRRAAGVISGVVGAVSAVKLAEKVEAALQPASWIIGLARRRHNTPSGSVQIQLGGGSMRQVGGGRPTRKGGNAEV
jgi:hypothetical protein